MTINLKGKARAISHAQNEIDVIGAQAFHGHNLNVENLIAAFMAETGLPLKDIEVITDQTPEGFKTYCRKRV